jgi:hypothetical protein
MDIHEVASQKWRKTKLSNVMMSFSTGQDKSVKRVFKKGLQLKQANK